MIMNQCVDKAESVWENADPRSGRDIQGKKIGGTSAHNLHVGRLLTGSIS